MKKLFRIKKIIFVLLYFLPCYGVSEIYKTESENGTVVFSDKPFKDSEKIYLIKANTYTENNPVQPTNSSEKQKKMNFYQKILIQQPQNNQNFNNEEEISVEINIKPDVRLEDTLFLSIDGRPYPIKETAKIPALYRGQHTLEAWVSDKQQKKLMVSEKITFFAGKTFSLNIRVF